MNVVISNLLAPISRRFGSFIAGSAVALGGTVEQAAQIELGMIALGMIGIDLILSRASRSIREGDS